MEKNIGNTDRIFRFFIGIILIYYAFIADNRLLVIISSIIGGISIYESYTGFCELYKLFNINTYRRK